MNLLNFTKDELWKIKNSFSKGDWDLRFALYYSASCGSYKVKATVRDLSRTNKSTKRF